MQYEPAEAENELGAKASEERALGGVVGCRAGVGQSRCDRGLCTEKDNDGPHGDVSQPAPSGSYALRANFSNPPSTHTMRKRDMSRARCPDRPGNSGKCWAWCRKAEMEMHYAVSFIFSLTSSSSSFRSFSSTTDISCATQCGLI